MAELENNLKTEINMRYGSIRAFAKLKDLPYNKILNLLKRGIDNSNLRIVKNICDAMDINLIELSEGNIVRNKKITVEEQNNEMGVLYNNLTEQGREEANNHLNYLLERHNKNNR